MEQVSRNALGMYRAVTAAIYSTQQLVFHMLKLIIISGQF